MTPLPPQPPPQVAQALDAPFFEVDPSNADAGEDIFVQCSWCHGDKVLSGGVAPDLRASPIPVSKEAFIDVLRTGSRRVRGTPSYDNMSDEHIEALQHYTAQEANRALSKASSAN